MVKHSNKDQHWQRRTGRAELQNFNGIATNGRAVCHLVCRKSVTSIDQPKHCLDRRLARHKRPSLEVVLNMNVIGIRLNGRVGHHLG